MRIGSLEPRGSHPALRSWIGGDVNLKLDMGLENPRETESPAECSSKNLQLCEVLTLLLTLLMIEMEGAHDA